MPDVAVVDAPFWKAFGILAAVIFYGRFYLQWFVSERQKQSVMPIGFWYLSGIGSCMLLIFGVATRSPIGTFSHGFNSIVYARNLVLVWKERGLLTVRRQTLVYGASAMLITLAAGLVAITWLREYQREQDPRHWVWVGVGVIAQSMFACRFLIQWLVSEVNQKSVVPVIFWHLSLYASLLLTCAHLAHGEWIFAGGVGSAIPVHIRNLWLIHAGKKPASPAAAG